MCLLYRTLLILCIADAVLDSLLTFISIPGYRPVSSVLNHQNSEKISVVTDAHGRNCYDLIMSQMT